ncbi:unnamed protein product [Choristocarpus tenellus]
MINEHKSGGSGVGGGENTHSSTPTLVKGKGEGGSKAEERPTTSDPAPKDSVVFYQEYDLTFQAGNLPFTLVKGPEGNGIVVSWGEDGGRDQASFTGSSVPDHVPAEGSLVLAVKGEPVALDAEPADVLAKVGVAGTKVGEENSQLDETVIDGDGDGDGDGDDKNVNDESESSASIPSVVIRFREKISHPMGVGQGSGGGDYLRNRVKAVAAGIGNLFAKETAGSVVRGDGSEVVGAGGLGGVGSGTAPAGLTAAAVLSTDAFALKFSTRDGVVSLPFTLAEALGGKGSVVSAVEEGYRSSLVQDGLVGPGARMGEGVGGGGRPHEDNTQDQGGVSERPELTPGAALLRVGGQQVEGKSLEEVHEVLTSAAAENQQVKLLFCHAPPIYRAGVVTELQMEAKEAGGDPHIHVGTWQPLLKRRAGMVSGGAGGGNPGVDGSDGGGSSIGGLGGLIKTIQTVTLPSRAKDTYVSSFEGRPSSLCQAVRLWFCFPGERTVRVRFEPPPPSPGDRAVEALVASGSSGVEWLIVRARRGSPCELAGFPAGENVILTHVNDLSVSPDAYQSLAPKAPWGGRGSGNGARTGAGAVWSRMVVPILETLTVGNSVALTFV